MNIVRRPNGYLAIRDSDALLAVPPFHPDTPSEVRTRIFALVLRRLFGEAYDVSASTWERRGTPLDRLAQLIQERPYAGEKRAA